ncbi:MAG: hypothetical protein ABW004_00245 [Aeromicrobium sp.]
MSTSRGSRRRTTRYFVRRTDGQRPEVARVTARGSSAVYEPATQSWLNDPLLAAAIRMTDDWTPARPEDLPDGLQVSIPAAEDARPRGRRRGRAGRHVAPPDPP